MTPKQASAAYRRTKSVKHVAKMAGCDFYSAKQLIVAGGGRLLGRRRKSKLTKDEMVRLYANHSLNQIAAKNGTSTSIVLRALVEAGIPRRNRGGGEFHNRQTKHNLTVRAREARVDPGRYMRLLAVKQLGARCRSCGNTDQRVLDLNHINGKGKTAGRCIRYQELLTLAKGGKLTYIEVLCCNCNRVHEYERGRILPLPAEFL